LLPKTISVGKVDSNRACVAGNVRHALQGVFKMWRTRGLG
jgi:hypothetical protein